VPLVMIGHEGRRRVVTAVDAAALASGLRPGMVATQAHALVPGLVTHDADPVADEEALSRLALWALRHYSPVIAADPPAGIAIDASGAAHLKGGEGRMLADLVEWLAASGMQVSIGAQKGPPIGVRPCGWTVLTI
jgi:protein ImuB